MTGEGKYIQHPLVSTIIPAYNAVLSIAKCVDSVLSQTYGNIEIIIVDDGSMDGTGSFIDNLASRHNNITALHQPNGGPNKARALGIANAHGEWLTFVDSDDTLAKDAIERFVDAVSPETDIVVGFSFDNLEPLHVVPIEKWRSDLIKSDIILCTPWGKLFRRSILDPKVCDLCTSNRAGNDMPMNIKIAFRSERDVVFIPGKVYNYNIIGDSISHGEKWSIDKVSNLYEEVLFSIPIEQRQAYMKELIDNRISSVHHLLINKNKGAIIYREDFFQELKNDIQSCRYKLSFFNWLCVRYPDSLFSEFFAKVGRKILILKQFVIRQLN